MSPTKHGEAGRRAGNPKPATPHTFTPSRPSGCATRTIHDLLGHSDVSTTMIHTHVLDRGGRAA